MCDECGCNDETEKKYGKTVELDESLEENENITAEQILHGLEHKKILSINIMGAPGCGKTTFIEKISESLGADKIFVIQGDLESDIDKVRLENLGIRAHQINTHSGCHLNSYMVEEALHDCDLKNTKFLLIENIGNLVCPANKQIGQHLDVVLSSVTEGEDKPEKYPIIFMNAALIIVTKMDISEIIGFDKKSYLERLKNINGKAEIIETGRDDKSGYVKVSEFIKSKWDEKYN